MTTELSVIVFAFDEEENVASILEELIAWLGAHDATLDRAKEALRGFPHELVRHETNRGIGAALKSGVKVARGEWMTFLPADGQIEPEAIGTLRAASNDVDLVLSVYDHRDDG